MEGLLSSIDYASFVRLSSYDYERFSSDLSSFQDATQEAVKSALQNLKTPEPVDSQVGSTFRSPYGDVISLSTDAQEYMLTQKSTGAQSEPMSPTVVTAAPSEASSLASFSTTSVAAKAPATDVAVRQPVVMAPDPTMGGNSTYNSQGSMATNYAARIFSAVA